MKVATSTLRVSEVPRGQCYKAMLQYFYKI